MCTVLYVDKAGEGLEYSSTEYSTATVRQLAASKALYHLIKISTTSLASEVNAHREAW